MIGRRHWTIEQLARRAKVTPARIRHLLQIGRLEGIKTNQDWLIPRREARVWLKGRVSGPKCEKQRKVKDSDWDPERLWIDFDDF